MARNDRHTTPDPQNPPALLPIAAALIHVRLQGVVEVRQVLRQIAKGTLRGAKVGREYLIDPLELQALYRPTIRPAATKVSAREGERARIARQLAQAGIAR